MSINKGPEDYTSSSQAQHWTFDEARLAAIRAQAHALAVGRVLELEPTRQSANQLPPRCTPLSPPSASMTRKRPRDSEPSSSAEHLLTIEEEQMVIAKYRSWMVEKLAPKYPQWASSDTLVASAAAYFTRFYVSNSCMEYDPVVVGLACLLLASKAEGTWGFLPALTLGPNEGGASSVRLQRDDSIHTKVPVRGGPRDAFALISSQDPASFKTATPPPPRVESSGSATDAAQPPSAESSFFFAIADPDEQSAKAAADRVLDAELSVLTGNAFYLLVHHPFNSLHALVQLLSQGVPLSPPSSTETPSLLPPEPPSSSAALEQGAPPVPTSSSNALHEATSLEKADNGSSEDFLGAQLLGQARSWLRRSLCSDLPLLFAPAELALGSLFAAAEGQPDCLLPFELGSHPEGAQAAIVARLSAQASATAAGASKVQQLSSEVLARAEAAKNSFQVLKASKPGKGQLKAAQAKLDACALWR